MSSKVMKKYNDPALSILRIVAAFAVVVIHSRILSDPSTVAYNFVYAAVLWSVPIFFMITGYIFLGMKTAVEYHDIKKNVFRFLVVLIVVGAFFRYQNMSLLQKQSMLK